MSATQSKMENFEIFPFFNKVRESNADIGILKDPTNSPNNIILGSLYLTATSAI